MTRPRLNEQPRFTYPEGVHLLSSSDLFNPKAPRRPKVPVGPLLPDSFDNWFPMAQLRIPAANFSNSCKGVCEWWLRSGRNVFSLKQGLRILVFSTVKIYWWFHTFQCTGVPGTMYCTRYLVYIPGTWYSEYQAPGGPKSQQVCQSSTYDMIQRTAKATYMNTITGT